MLALVDYVKVSRARSRRRSCCRKPPNERAARKTSRRRLSRRDRRRARRERATRFEAYRRDLGDYVDFLERRSSDALRAKADDVSAFLAARGADGLGAASLARRLSAIRQFHKHLYVEGAAARRSDAGDRRAAPRPSAAQGARASRKSTRILAAAREGIDAPERPPRRTPRRGARRLPDRAHLRLGPARFRALSLPKSAARAKEPLLDRPRQGRQGTAGPDLRRRRAPRFEPIARCSTSSRRRRRRALAVSRRRRERPSHAARSSRAN